MHKVEPEQTGNGTGKDAARRMGVQAELDRLVQGDPAQGQNAHGPPSEAPGERTEGTGPAHTASAPSLPAMFIGSCWVKPFTPR